MSLNDSTNSQPAFTLEMKTCAETLQSAQKRMRIAFFLSLSASCIVSLMVFNLWESRRLRSTELIKSSTSDPEYLKEYSKHIADDSFYQLPALGIQIACDDVGFLGPLALLVFSFNSLMAFKACNCQVECAGRFAEAEVVNTLLKSEMLPGLPKFLYCFLLLLPFIACTGVAAYRISAYFYGAPLSDPLHDILSKDRTIAEHLDMGGLILVVFVLICNVQVVRSLDATKTKTEECIKRHAASKSTRLPCK